MYLVHDLSDWEVDELVVTPGRRGKDWLVEPETRRYGLFKRPHYHASEAAAEKVAAELGPILGVPTADTDLAVRNGVQGIISYKFLAPGESLVDGGDLIIGIRPEYERTRGKDHSFKVVEEALRPRALVESIVQLIVFDAVIGNTDRHQDNWSVIVSPEGDWRLAPSYDHGSCLGSHIAEHEITEYRGTRLASYVARGRSRVGWHEGTATRQLRHIELLRRIAGLYPEMLNAAVSRAVSAPWSEIQAVVEAVPGEFATEGRRTLMCDIVAQRVGVLRDAYSGGWD